MKLNKILTLVGFSFGLAITAQAGEEASGKHVIAPAPSCLWSWFAGGSVGKIDGDDWDEDIYTLHIGKERKCAGESHSHAVYLEIGLTDDDLEYKVSQSLGGSVFDIYSYDIEIIPITLNYKYEDVLINNINYYIGVGAGLAIVDFDFSIGNSSGSENDTVFYGNIFAGLNYNVSETCEIYGGARLIIMNDFKGLDSPLDDEIHYELGARCNF
jgi:hypothetical protein